MTGRHGISSAEVDALLQLFRQIDRGGDPRILMRSEPVRRFRAALQRITDGTRKRYGGRKRAPADAPAENAPAADDFPDIDGSDGQPGMADRVLGMFDLEEDG